MQVVPRAGRLRIPGTIHFDMGGIGSLSRTGRSGEVRESCGGSSLVAWRVSARNFFSNTQEGFKHTLCHMKFADVIVQKI